MMAENNTMSEIKMVTWTNMSIQVPLLGTKR